MRGRARHLARPGPDNTVTLNLVPRLDRTSNRSDVQKTEGGIIRMSFTETQLSNHAFRLHGKMQEQGFWMR